MLYKNKGRKACGGNLVTHIDIWFDTFVTSGNWDT